MPLDQRKSPSFLFAPAAASLTRRAVLGAAGLALVTSHATAQPRWPSRPISVVIPYTAGGIFDIIARLIAEKLSARLGQPVIVDAKPGGNTVIAINHVLNQPADGHTFLLHGNVLAFGPVIQPDQFKFDPLKDFTALGLIGYGKLAVVVHPKGPAKNLSELIALARAKPGTVTVGVIGLANHDSLAMQLLASKAGVSFNMIPYKGAADANNDLLAGRLDARATSIGNFKQYVDAGRMNALAVFGARSDLLPGVPSVSEAVSGMEFPEQYYAIFGRSDVPPAVTAKVSAELEAVMATPELRSRLRDAGIEPKWGSPDVTARLVRDEVQVWNALVKAKGIKIEN
ncbi:tripartite tricarboxylate transporter substrate binding protein [Hydrogenophaga sp.]|uniref:Bug family tripartite tricarboxylate transporter substrate binding protein n=1 Tax=Hydrogenophaga sp. TaxID=1904254 RepID=UPI00271C049B|nr:tripartite tricarboxylate transporter substrate binding protein [Hydrogenophaga sp.]MDO9436997.1 tripartite tricarboxylate transporter substrate binding protein [Hydrogenophaga sp.]